MRRRPGRDRPGERLSVDRARLRHRVRRMGPAQARSSDVAVDPAEGLLRRRRRLRPEEHHLGGGARPRRGDLDRQVAAAARTSRSGRRRASTSSARRWASTSGATTTTSPSTSASRCRCRDKEDALKNIKVEVELGFDPQLAFKEAQRCLNCDVQTVFTGSLCIECDACVDICPMDCITFTANGEEKRSAPPSAVRRRSISTQDIYVADGLKTGRIMAKDEDVCLHCGLCAERCPTGAWDMQKFLHRHDPARATHAISNSCRQRFRRQVRQRQRLGLGQRQRAVRASRSCAWACRSARATSSPPTSRACRPGTRCASPRRASSAGAAAST